eukprot:ANDGO_02481.mRNA.1 hypothetical protein GUITHDRAFT_111821
MSYVKPIGDGKILDKKVPRNPKYETVGAVIDTGNNVRKFLEKNAVHLHARFRKEEHFKRIKRNTLAQLLQTIEKDGEVLVLDVRSPEEYEECHLNESVSYPSTVFFRSVNNYSPQVMRFFNKENHIVVIYDNDEKLYQELGNHFYERNIDNVYALTGGLPEFAELYPELLSSPMPERLIPKKSPVKKVGSSRSSVASSSRHNMSSRTSTFSSVAPSRK